MISKSNLNKGVGIMLIVMGLTNIDMSARVTLESVFAMGVSFAGLFFYSLKDWKELNND